jgi:hypothetical protein
MSNTGFPSFFTHPVLFWDKAEGMNKEELINRRVSRVEV